MPSSTVTSRMYYTGHNSAKQPSSNLEISPRCHRLHAPHELPSKGADQRTRPCADCCAEMCTD